MNFGKIAQYLKEISDFIPTEDFHKQCRCLSRPVNDVHWFDVKIASDFFRDNVVYLIFNRRNHGNRPYNLVELCEDIKSNNIDEKEIDGNTLKTIKAL